MSARKNFIEYTLRSIPDVGLYFHVSMSDKDRALEMVRYSDLSFVQKRVLSTEIRKRYIQNCLIKFYEPKSY